MSRQLHEASTSKIKAKPIPRVRFFPRRPLSPVPVEKVLNAESLMEMADLSMKLIVEKGK